ncbi:hypothetical protein AZI86_07175 [Bdellovibrio bacteriovorus]|uniref:Uncharacterized protein n=1 Tax=Bdellovibrio bacteriovorus TaxID=959 RepID=A0A150WQP8_BDEBC|nr:hypothetical protein AZI86_07175 [Bdellovibrio bacteriovorus]
MAFIYSPPRRRFFKGEKKNVSFRLPKDMISYYEELAKESGLTLTDILIDVLDQAADSLNKHPLKNNRSKR